MPLSSIASTLSARWRRGVLPVCTAVLLLLESAAESRAHGAYHDVIARLNADLAKDPARADLLFRRATVHLGHDEAGACIADLAKVDQLSPSKFSTDLVRGQALLKLDQPAKAKEVLDRFIAAHPQHAEALAARGRAFRTLGETEAAIADYRTALALTDRPEPDLVEECAGTLFAAGRPGEAMAVLARAIELLGPVPSLVLRALDAEIDAGDFDAALGRIDALQKMGPRPEPWMAKRARVLAQAGRTAEARAAWEALAAHLAALPNLERGSHAMSKLAAEAAAELKAPTSPKPIAGSPPRPHLP
jgi:tetratricopeptide (TPR) repeat protein